MIGAPCPRCGGQVMTFGQFFRTAEPNKTFKCAACGVELGRNPLVWVTLLVVAIPAVWLGLAAGRGSLSPVVAGGLFILALLVFVPVVKIINYKLPLWRVHKGVSR